MILKCCAGIIHSKQPKDCKGGTWCDCQHRLPHEIKLETNEEKKNV